MGRGPETIGNILAELMARQGFARCQGASRCEDAWRQAAGELAARHTRVGAIRSGRLEVIVANSTVLHELTFRKAELVKALTQLLPDQPIRDLRFRVGLIA